jgi:uncharacterized membrane protein YfhO
MDGNEVEILRLNYLFRGVIVPQGNHTLEMKFEPASFLIGRPINLAFNIVVLIGIVVPIGKKAFDWYRKRTQRQNSIKNAVRTTEPKKTEV